MVGQIDPGDMGAKGAGVDDLSGPGRVGHGMRGGQRSVSVTRGDHVDTLYVLCQFHILAADATGVRSGVGEYDHDVNALGVSQPVHQALDDAVPGGEVSEAYRRRDWSVEACGLAHEDDVAHSQPVREILTPRGLDGLPVADQSP